MLKFPKKASFYTKTDTFNDYGEPISTGALSFDTGVRLTTLSFADMVKSTGTIDTGKFYVFTRKNPNTLSVVAGDFVKVEGQTFEITGVDPMYGNRSDIMFLVDLVEDPVV
jgi:DNA/RNA endonuclease YhcR with UshA esterase domain|tara:strand:+ start:442 stop:774 length:333 start_codon:yes stop_codon:yes gene_type:complete